MRIAVCVSNNSLEKQTIELIKKLESHYVVFADSYNPPIAFTYSTP